MNDTFDKSLRISIIIHFSLGAGLILLSHFNFLSFISPAKTINIPDAIKVDIVGMPTLTLKELENLPRVNQSTDNLPVLTDDSSEATDDKPKVEESPAQVVETEAKVEIKKKKTIEKDSKKLSGKAISELRKLVLAGNKLSKGSSMTGEESSRDLTQIEDYFVKIRERVRLFWRLPSFLLDKDLRAKVRLYINEKGELKKVVFMEKSGSSDYDSRVEEAIKSASPFDVPSKEILDTVSSGELELVFPF